jgi:RNA polymerase sigma-70 factor (ECF subfamily)
VTGAALESGAQPVADREPDTRGRREAAVVSTHLPFVWRFLRRLGLSAEDADDVAQEVFLVATRKLDRIEENQEKRFLFGIAVRIASRSRRSERLRSSRTAAGVELDECRSPDLATDEVVARKEARAVLDQILSEMTPDLRTAFVLFELEEMTMVEIAALTETPLGTVASRLRRAREQFQAAAKSRQP